MPCLCFCFHSSSALFFFFFLFADAGGHLFVLFLNEMTTFYIQETAANCERLTLGQRLTTGMEMVWKDRPLWCSPETVCSNPSFTDKKNTCDIIQGGANSVSAEKEWTIITAKQRTRKSLDETQQIISIYSLRFLTLAGNVNEMFCFIWVLLHSTNTL